MKTKSRASHESPYKNHVKKRTVLAKAPNEQELPPMAAEFPTSFRFAIRMRIYYVSFLLDDMAHVRRVYGMEHVIWVSNLEVLNQSNISLFSKNSLTISLLIFNTNGENIILLHGRRRNEN